MRRGLHEPRQRLQLSGHDLGVADTDQHGSRTDGRRDHVDGDERDPTTQGGMASGTQGTTRQLGGALGVAVLGSVLSARYSSSLSKGLAGTNAASYLPDARRSLAAALRAASPTQPLAPSSSKLRKAPSLKVCTWPPA
jgi:hypothetical protein